MNANTLIKRCHQIYNHPFCCFRHYIYLFEFKSLCYQLYEDICKLEAIEQDKDFLATIDHAASIQKTNEIIEFFKAKEKEML